MRTMPMLRWGLGFYVVDIRDPSQMKVVGHVNFPPSVAGTEGDFIDVSQVQETGPSLLQWLSTQ